MAQVKPGTPPAHELNVDPRSIVSSDRFNDAPMRAGTVDQIDAMRTHQRPARPEAVERFGARRRMPDIVLIAEGDVSFAAQSDRLPEIL